MEFALRGGSTIFKNICSACHGTGGKVKKDVILVTNEDDARNVEIDSDKIAYVTQTTLSVDDTKKIVDILQDRFPVMTKSLATKDICYATQNRQDAVRQLSKNVDLVLVIGSKNSSNSNRLRDLAEECGIDSYLINDSSQINSDWFKSNISIGVTAGASAPEVLVEEALERIQQIAIEKSEDFTVETMSGKIENTIFALPRKVRK